MQDDNRYDQGYRRREPGRNDRDDELRASRRYGDPDHPGMISDRDWAGPSEYSRHDQGRSARGGDYGGGYGRGFKLPDYSGRLP